MAIVKMSESVSQWLGRACDMLGRLRACKADSMLDFADKDPIAFCEMVFAMDRLSASVTREVRERYNALLPRVWGTDQPLVCPYCGRVGFEGRIAFAAHLSKHKRG